MARRKPEPETQTEVAMAVVYRRTPDGFAVGRAVVPLDAVEWLTPTHMRDWQETRPKDMLLKSEKVLVDGLITLRPTRVAKGRPVLQTVGKHVVFGELADAAVNRAKTELQEQVAAELRRNVSTWRHLCAKQTLDGLPLWAPTPTGEACAHCGLDAKGKVAA